MACDPFVVLFDETEVANVDAVLEGGREGEREGGCEWQGLNEIGREGEGRRSNFS